MEKQQGIEYVIIVGSIIVVFIGVAFVLFIIGQRRRRHTDESIIKILEAQKDVEIDKLKKENKEIKTQLKDLGSKINGLIEKDTP